jgi:hypothetical protein
MKNLPDVTAKQVKEIDDLLKSEFEVGNWITVDSEQALWSRELVKAIAMDIGKETCAYVEVMYPNVWAAGNSGFKLSLRNHIYNEIMAAIEVNEAGQITARLADRKKFRRWWTAAYRKIKRKT